MLGVENISFTVPYSSSPFLGGLRNPDEMLSENSAVSSALNWDQFPRVSDSNFRQLSNR